MDSEEQYCIEALRQLQLAYEREAKPYIIRLARIRATRLNPIYLPATEAQVAQYFYTEEPLEVVDLIEPQPPR